MVRGQARNAIGRRTGLCNSFHLSTSHSARAAFPALILSSTSAGGITLCLGSESFLIVALTSYYALACPQKWLLDMTYLKVVQIARRIIEVVVGDAVLSDGLDLQIRERNSSSAQIMSTAWIMLLITVSSRYV